MMFDLATPAPAPPPPLDSERSDSRTVIVPCFKCGLRYYEANPGQPKRFYFCGMCRPRRADIDWSYLAAFAPHVGSLSIMTLGHERDLSCGCSEAQHRRPWQDYVKDQMLAGRGGTAAPVLVDFDESDFL